MFAGAAALGVGAAAATIFKGAIEQASGLEEAGTKITAIFGDQGSAAVQKFADQGAKALGQNRLAVLDSAATFGTMGKAAGLGGRELAKFSTGFASLSTDLASFNNSTPEEATEALGAALRGEAEPIRRFGVLLDDATLRNEALRLGLVKTTKEALTPQQKVLAAQAAIYKQTSDAQGDFQRTSGGLANQQRILSAQWTDMKGVLGSALLPAVTSLFTTLNNRVIPGVKAFIASFRSGSGPASALGSVIGRVSDAARSLAQWFMGSVVPAVRSALIPVIARGRVEFAKLQAAVEDNRPQLMQLLNGFKAVANFIGTKVLPVLAVLRGVAFVALIAAIRGVINAIGAGVSAFNSIRSAIITAAETVGRFNSAVREKVGAALSFIQAVPGRILAIFASAPTLLYNAGVQLMTGLASGITNKIEDAINAVRSGLSRLKGLLPGSPIKWGPLKNWNNGGAGKRLMDLVTLGITKGTPKTIEAAQTAFGKIGDALKSTRSDLQSTLDGLKNDFASLADSVAQAFTGDLFGVTATEAAAGVAGRTVGENFFANLIAKRADLTSMLSSFKTLQGWGLAPSFLSQLFASGNGALITELAGMGQSNAQVAGQLFTDVTNLGAQLGGAVATNDPVTSRIDETNRLLTTVSSQLGYLGSDIGKELNGVAAKAQRDKKNKKGRK